MELFIVKYLFLSLDQQKNFLKLCIYNIMVLTSFPPLDEL